MDLLELKQEDKFLCLGSCLFSDFPFYVLHQHTLYDILWQAQSSRCHQNSIPMCWEASTQFGAPITDKVTGPEDGAEAACNQQG